MLTEQVPESWTPSSDTEREAVLRQLDMLLATPLFNSSKRYPSFLKLVVARTLAGETDQLKERILGVEIFGRPADYDTNTDPIVRVTAAEIRKRIEQYYQDPKRNHEIRLFLPVGSYAPQFAWPGRPTGLVAPIEVMPARAAVPVDVLPTVDSAHTRAKRTFLSGKNLAVALGLMVLVGGLGRAGDGVAGLPAESS